MLENDHYFKSSLEDKTYFLNEIATVTKTGVYNIRFDGSRFFIDAIGRSILNIPNKEKLTLKDASRLFFKEQNLKSILQTCLKGEFYEAEVRMLSFNNEKIWMKLTGKPQFDTNNAIIGIRGVFTSINKYVRDREEVEQHSRIIESQNDRLLHFAHIISHNLRSHSSNLALTLELFEDVSKEEKSKVFYSYLNEISQNLNTTLEHLNQVVTVSSQSSTFAMVDLKAIVKKVLHHHKTILDAIDARLHLDFSDFEYIEYVSSFFEGIMETLISNAIKHRAADRKLEIHIYTKLKQNKKLIVFKYNGGGLGIEKDASAVFSNNHLNNNKESPKHLGLFLAKNQVEALGGDMVVKSKKDKGTKFTIKF